MWAWLWGDQRGYKLEFQVPGGWAWRRRAETTAVKWGAAWGLLGKPQRPGLGHGRPPLTRGRSGGVPWSPGWRRSQSQHTHWWRSWLCWWWCCLCFKWRKLGKVHRRITPHDRKLGSVWVTKSNFGFIPASAPKPNLEAVLFPRFPQSSHVDFALVHVGNGVFEQFAFSHLFLSRYFRWLCRFLFPHWAPVQPHNHCTSTTNWWCLECRETDSTRTKLQHTNWLGIRTAACADSSSFWQPNKCYLQPPPNPGSNTVSMCGRALKSEWHLLISHPVPVLLS